jgi:hypothetical protein
MPRIHRSILALATTLASGTLLAALSLGAGGCASTPTATEERAPASFTVLSRNAETSAPAVDARDLVGAAGETRTLEVVAGREKGERRTQRVVAGAEGEVVLEESTRAGLERSVLAPRADGGFTLRSVDTPGEDSRSVFADGLDFARARLSPGERNDSASPMRVTLLSSGAPRAKGTATRAQRITGTAVIDLCGERLDATIVETVFEAKLDAARARRESELFVVPGRGVVAEIWREKITVLGIFPKTTEETVVVVPTKAAP